MDLHLEDMFESEELGALSFSGRTSFGLSASSFLKSPAVRRVIKSANKGGRVTVKKRTTTKRSPRQVPASSKKRKTTSAKTAISSITRGVSKMFGTKPKPATKSGMFSALTLPSSLFGKIKVAKKPIGIMPSFAKPAPISFAERVSTSVSGQAPISETHPRAYRHMACNAGMGGEAQMTLLKQIAELVKLADTRAVATSEHNALRNTEDFRRAVLRGLRCKMQRANR